MEEKEKVWITADICHMYRKKAEQLTSNGNQDIDEWRSLRIELQQKYGVTELQAFNILRGINVGEYVHDYAMQNGVIPMTEEMKRRIEIKDAKIRKGDSDESRKITDKDLLKQYSERLDYLEKMARESKWDDFGFEEKD